MKPDTANFNAKLLLFGEYLLLMGSDALVIPISKYKGRLAFSQNQNTLQRNSSANLKRFYDFLKVNELQFPAKLNLKLSELLSDLNKGLFFESDIPVEYGLGSSGALVAAIYSSYSATSSQELDSNSLLKLKSSLAFMESYFHGNSSGIDPLSCFIGLPLLLRSDSTIERVPFPSFKEQPEMAFFILDTLMSSKTQDMVAIFRSKLSKGEFHSQLEQKLIPLNNRCIENLLNQNSKEFLLDVKKLSAFQFNYFREMIPLEIQEIWRYGIDKELYSLKLCGSGGGGFVLGISENFSQSVDFFKLKGMDLIRITE